MKILRLNGCDCFVIGLVCVSLFVLPSGIQQSAFAQNRLSARASDDQAASVVRQSALALDNRVEVHDLRLAAEATWVAGGTHETGAAELKAKGTAESRLDISAGPIVRSELRSGDSEPQGEWLDASGKSHRFAQHNCWTPAVWFTPALLITSALQPDSVLRYVGREVRDGISVDHVHEYQVVSGEPAAAAEMRERLTGLDIYIAADTHLPVALAFNVHADNDVNRDIPIEIRYSDYRPINGVQVAFHIQRLLQHTLNLDLTVTAAVPNAGISDSEFALQ